MATLNPPSLAYGIKVLTIFIIILLSIIFLLFRIKVYNVVDGKLLSESNRIICVVALSLGEQLRKEGSVIIVTAANENILCNINYMYTKEYMLYFNLNCGEKEVSLNGNDSVRIKFGKNSLFSQMTKISPK